MSNMAENDGDDRAARLRSIADKIAERSRELYARLK